MKYGPVGHFIVDPVEVEARLKRKEKVPEWIVEVARKKREIMRQDGSVKAVYIHDHWGTY